MTENVLSSNPVLNLNTVTSNVKTTWDIVEDANGKTILRVNEVVILRSRIPAANKADSKQYAAISALEAISKVGFFFCYFLL